MPSQSITTTGQRPDLRAGAPTAVVDDDSASIARSLGDETLQKRPPHGGGPGAARLAGREIC